ncbi:MAG: VPLPA-CTERM sorting domain-containing protein [Litoreibacter sp.]
MFLLNGDLVKLIPIAIAATLSLSAAQASVIDFNSFGDGGLVETIFSTDGLVSASVSAVGGANEARAFDTTNQNSHDNDLEAPFRNDLDRSIIANPGNVLIVQEAAFQASGTPDDNRSGGLITFFFDQRIDFSGFTIYDDARVTVTSDTGSSAVEEVSADGRFNIFDFDAGLFAGVTSLTFDFNGHSGAIDDLRFEVSAVPVPASLPLLMIGVGGLAALRRRNRG